VLNTEKTFVDNNMTIQKTCIYANGQIITQHDGNTLDYDENGNMTSGVDTTLVYNWDSKLRSGQKDGNSISLKYDPAGNRIQKNSSIAGNRKYIVDIVGDLPVILLVLDDSQNVLKKYIYANSQIVAQHDVNDNNKLYFYLHDRLGSVRQLINTSGIVIRLYTYNPFGETLETDGSFANPFKFSGQFFDDEIGQYHLRARQYDPYISRFTSRDPVMGKFKEPLTLHVYLYCTNNPINLIDPWGLESKEMNALLRSAIIEKYMIEWDMETAVEGLASVADMSAYYRKNDRTAFVEDLLWLFTECRGPNLLETYTNAFQIYGINFGQSGFKEEYGGGKGQNQVMHFVGYLAIGYYWGPVGYPAAWIREENEPEDIALGFKGVTLGGMIRSRSWPAWSPIGSGFDLKDVGNWIISNLAEGQEE
jgi:RHS repeat-associated protein